MAFVDLTMLKKWVPVERLIELSHPPATKDGTGAIICPTDPDDVVLQCAIDFAEAEIISYLACPYSAPYPCDGALQMHTISLILWHLSNRDNFGECALDEKNPYWHNAKLAYAYLKKVQNGDLHVDGQAPALVSPGLAADYGCGIFSNAALKKYTRRDLYQHDLCARCQSSICSCSSNNALC